MPEEVERCSYRFLTLLKPWTSVNGQCVICCVPGSYRGCVTTKSPRTKRLLKPATVDRELATLRMLFNQNIRNGVVSAQSRKQHQVSRREQRTDSRNQF